MDIAVILVELGIMCLVFFVLVIGLLFISPLTFISDYPPEIQEQYYKYSRRSTLLFVYACLICMGYILFGLDTVCEYKKITSSGD